MTLVHDEAKASSVATEMRSQVALVAAAC